MKTIFATCTATLALLAGPAIAQTKAPAVTRYEIAFPNAVHHEAQVTVTWRDLGPAPLRVQMSRSSPGRYAIHEFAKNVYSLAAKDGRGRALAMTRTDPYGWTISGHDGTVSVTYTLFGDHGDGTYAQIDATHAHLNMPATFLWAVGQDARPISVRFVPFDTKWKVATQLQPTGDPYTFAAPNFQYFMDSPTELSNFDLREWQVEEGPTRATIRLAVHHDGSPADLDRFAASAKKVVAQHIAMWGEHPAYDFGTYTFIADYVPQISGDGMEHRNSTIISQPRSFTAANFAQIDTLSHEFFHSWNVERIRPAELEPFDFTRANPTPSLWLAEGFTQYYGPLMIRRAGESAIDAYLRGVGSTVNALTTGTARRYGGPQEMSLRAPFVDAAKSIDATNPNIFVSYYTYGAGLALALDLTLRQRYPGITLDTFMRHLWQTFGKPERPYTRADLSRALGEVTKDPAFADAFFRTSVDAEALPDYAPLLDQAGLKLRPANPTAAWLGNVRLKTTGTDVRIDGAPAPDTPLYPAGLDNGDQIVSLGGTVITSDADAAAALGRYKPGQTADITYRQRGLDRRATLTFLADPTVEVVRYETAGVKPTAQQLAFRAAWLGPDVVAN
ncbi:MULTISPECIES: M61 family metallopeptidase [Sphingomonas]|uniref:M61 family metallopeptidase n=1 Tax=Sphingomonas TaxID=13687 RepID=UPI0006FDEEE5|nr:MULTISPECIES: PDZ domain-containing protein [Sphingomonas]KQM89631.1 peptidase M61 [Sphingomonas sp. Leaf226]MDY0966619.1 PDZ domain-containing protein [Sphingomonas sp. CFBP9021]USR01923.1 PDZ domain-containing protein [Sphingomonas aerolata]